MHHHKPSIETPLKRVRGLGSAKDGTHHWWMQRVTAVALIPLSLWLVYTFNYLALSDAETVKLWLQSPFQALILALFLGTACYHGKLGLQVVIEDYVHCHTSKNALLLANAFGFIILAGMALMAIARLHFASLA